MALKFRRGTTAQKSGSLAFGEPYVNTTLGTLQIGLDTGDVTLSATGTGSNLVVGGISGSSLDITGNAKIDGNLTLGGQLTIGDATSDTVNVVASLSSSLIPSETNAFDLGSTTKIWKDLYISTGSIKFTDATGNVVRAFGPDTLTLLEASTGSSNQSITVLNAFTASQESKDSTLATYTASLDTKHTTLASVTGSLNSFTSSINTTIKTKLNAEGVVSGSSQINLASVTGNSTSNVTEGSNLYYTDARVKTKLNSEGVVSGSSQITLSSTTGGGTTANVQFGSLGIGMAASGTSGRIDASGDIVAYSTSDRNFKENITPIPNALEKISKISGNTYDWKEELKDIHGFEGNDVGVIAQEIEEVLPQLVTTRETGYKAVKYDKLVALLIEGIKEQQTQIHNLTLEVENLKKQKGL